MLFQRVASAYSSKDSEQATSCLASGLLVHIVLVGLLLLVTWIVAPLFPPGMNISGHDASILSGCLMSAGIGHALPIYRWTLKVLSFVADRLAQSISGKYILYVVLMAGGILSAFSVRLSGWATLTVCLCTVAVACSTLMIFLDPVFQSVRAAIFEKLRFAGEDPRGGMFCQCFLMLPGMGSLSVTSRRREGRSS